jgi:hypothetical protein
LEFVQLEISDEMLPSLHVAQIAIIEQYIAANASFFVGTQHSSFSTTIRTEMTNRGHKQSVVNLQRLSS